MPRTLLLLLSTVGLLFGASACSSNPGESGATGGSAGRATGGAAVGGTGGESQGTGGDGSLSSSGGVNGSGGTSSSGGASGGNGGPGGRTTNGSGGALSTGGAAASGGRGGSGGGSVLGTGGAGGRAGVIHPGGLFDQADMDRLRANVASGSPPWAAAWNAIRASDAGTGYQPTVSATITAEYDLQTQGHAAYVLAVKWIASGDPAFATAAKRVLDAWVNTVTSIASPQVTLRTGIGTVQMANAAEIIAYGFNGAAGWPPSQVSKAKTWFSNVVWPKICAGNLQRSSNWGTSALAGCMSTAIFVGEPAKLEYAISAYKNGFTDGPDGCAGVTQYVCNAAGQATEAGRDQTHPQGGVAHLVETALMAWHQGLNLVTYGNNRVVAGMEYLAKYNLGHDDVPYDPNFPDPCNVHPSWTVISTTGRGSFSPVYEMADRLFTVAGVAHPYTTMVLASPGYRPEKTNSDHAGMGTLLMAP